jgi:hypothetical protein
MRYISLPSLGYRSQSPEEPPYALHRPPTHIFVPAGLRTRCRCAIPAACASKTGRQEDRDRLHHQDRKAVPPRWLPLSVKPNPNVVEGCPGEGLHALQGLPSAAVTGRAGSLTGRCCCHGTAQCRFDLRQPFFERADLLLLHRDRGVLLLQLVKKHRVKQLVPDRFDLPVR